MTNLPDIPVTMRDCLKCGKSYDSMGEPLLPFCMDCLIVILRRMGLYEA